MICRACGTEIADKALICYRCGAAVQEAVTKSAPLEKTRPISVYVVFVVLVLLAIAIMFLRH